MRRQSRLFALAEHLRARKTGVTAQALADRFEVSVRTIHRDLDVLIGARSRVVLFRASAKAPGFGAFSLPRAGRLTPFGFVLAVQSLIPQLQFSPPALTAGPATRRCVRIARFIT